MNTSGIPCRCCSDDGGPAFPLDERHGDGTHYQSHAGMSLRDYFAGKAVQGAITTSGAPWLSPDKDCAESVARAAYEIADAMLRARATGEKS